MIFLVSLNAHAFERVFFTFFRMQFSYWLKFKSHAIDWPIICIAIKKNTKTSLQETSSHLCLKTPRKSLKYKVYPMFTGSLLQMMFEKSVNISDILTKSFYK